MQTLRIWITINLLWFFALLNIERFHEPINISTFVYILAMVLAISVVAIPPMRDRTTSFLLGGALAIFVTLKYLLGYQILGQMLPITVTEGLAIGVSVLIAHRLAWSIRQFEESVLELHGLQLSKQYFQFDELQEDVYREVRRARKFERPLSVITLDVPICADNPAVDRLIVEVQKKLHTEHLRNQLIQLINKELSDSDILSLRDDNFVLVLTESNRERAERICKKVNRRIEEFLQCSVRTGIASFPDEEVTLTGLLSRSLENLDVEEIRETEFNAPDKPTNNNGFADQNGTLHTESHRSMASSD